jgi:hypothetical protein
MSCPCPSRVQATGGRSPGPGKPVSRPMRARTRVRSGASRNVAARRCRRISCETMPWRARARQKSMSFSRPAMYLEMARSWTSRHQPLMKRVFRWRRGSDGRASRAAERRWFRRRHRRSIGKLPQDRLATDDNQLVDIGNSAGGADGCVPTLSDSSSAVQGTQREAF